MRTLSEVNKDIEECKKAIDISRSKKDILHYKAVLYELKDEKEEIWNALFNGHRNRSIHCR